MNRLQPLLINAALILAAIACSIFLLMIGLWMAGYPAHLVLAKWIASSVGSRFDIMISIKNACPLIFTGLAAAVAFRSGVFNIGAEGQYVLGTIGAITVATRLLPPGLTPWLGIPAALVAAAILGAAWAAIASLLDRFRGVPIVLSTILLNFIAVQFLGILLEGPLKAPGEIVQSDMAPPAFRLSILSQIGSLHAGILIALAAALFLWILQARTTFGFELQAVGLNPVAARLAGMPVRAREMAVMLLSGAFAGLGGGVQILGVTHYLGTDSPGYGYTGIAVALLGRLHPVGVTVAAFFFGFLDQGASNVEISQYELPHEVADIVKGLMVLVILIAAAYAARLKSRAKERA
jgi:simple sugar transport system permease protein